ncbi:MAG: prepilin peptidase [Chloroflexota bacterium]
MVLQETASTALVALAGLVGLAVGSFLNVCSDRLPRGQSIVVVPSHCDSCGHPLAPWDLAPLASFLWLRGRCRYCRAHIPRRIPLVELATGILFAFVIFRYGITTQAGVLLPFVGVLVVVFVVDLEHSLILNKVIYPSMAVALVVAPWGPVGHGLSIQSAYLEVLKGVLVGGGAPFIIYLLARGGFGAGDVKLGSLLGLMMGFIPVIVTLQLSFLVGGMVAATLMVLRIRRRKDPIPFGPFLAGAGVVGLFWGHTIFQWYQGLFN